MNRECHRCASPVLVLSDFSAAGSQLEAAAGLASSALVPAEDQGLLQQELGFHSSPAMARKRLLQVLAVPASSF